MYLTSLIRINKIFISTSSLLRRVLYDLKIILPYSYEKCSLVLRKTDNQSNARINFTNAFLPRRKFLLISICLTLRRIKIIFVDMDYLSIYLSIFYAHAHTRTRARVHAPHTHTHTHNRTIVKRREYKKEIILQLLYLLYSFYCTSRVTIK